MVRQFESAGSTILLWEIYRIKGRKLMIKISQEIAKQLNSNYGVPYGENGISHTVGKGKKKTYYLCESPRNVRFLEKLTTK